MAESIEQYYVSQWQNTIRVLSQQMDSRLAATTIPPVAQKGEYLYWERIGSTEAVELNTRHDDTPNIEPDHSRRRQSAQPYVWATLLDKQDEARMLVDPKSYYNRAAVMAMNRAKDDVIIYALENNAYSGQSGTTAVALPAAQKIAHGSASLTISKLISAKEILDEAEVDEEAERYLVCASNQISNLLATTEIKSADYNEVKALVQGKIDTYLGFKFIRSQRLTLSGGYRYAYAYTKGAVGFGVLDEIQSKIDMRVDKNYAWQCWVYMDIGATRVEDECVVQIACTES